MKKILLVGIFSIIGMGGTVGFSKYLNSCELAEWYSSHVSIAIHNHDTGLAHAYLVNASIFQQRCEGEAMQ